MKWRKWIDYFTKKELVAVKLTYFFWSGKGVFLSYLPLYLECAGLSPISVCLVFSTRVISKFLGNIFWSFVTDRMYKYRVIAIELCFFSVVFTLPQPIIVRANEKKGIAAHKTNNTRHGLVYILSSMNAIGGFFEGGLQGQVDNFAVQYIAGKGSIKSYGVQRMFGVLGSIAIASSIGIVVDLNVPEGFTSYSSIYFFHATLTVFFAASFYMIAKWLETTGRQVRDNENNASGGSFSFEIFKSMEIYPFYILVFINGYAYGANLSVSMMHLLNLNASPATIACFVLVMYASCVVVYPFTSTIVHHCGGELQVITLSIFVYSLRFIAMGYLRHPLGVVLLQLTHGINGALFWVAAIEYTYNKSDYTNANSLFGVLNAVYKGASRFLGIIISGVVFERYGGHLFYLSMGMCFSAIAAVSQCYVFYIRTKVKIFERRSSLKAKTMEPNDVTFYRALFMTKTRSRTMSFIEPPGISSLSVEV